MSAPKSLKHRESIPAGAVLSRAEAQAIVEKVVKMSKADSINVTLNTNYNTNVRFADNQMSTAGVSNTTTIRVQSVYGKRKASAVTNNRTDEGLQRVVEQSEALARLAPEDPEYLGELGPQQYVGVSAWDDGTADLSAEARAQAALGALAPARAAKDITVAGFLVTSAGATGVGNSAGLFAYHRSTSVPHTSPAPKPLMTIRSSRLSSPSRVASSRAMGMEPPDVLP